ncbi:hypothetical protein MHYP_G00025550 [Metynnis hypsauchen]
MREKEGGLGAQKSSTKASRLKDHTASKYPVSTTTTTSTTAITLQFDRHFGGITTETDRSKLPIQYFSWAVCGGGRRKRADSSA